MARTVAIFFLALLLTAGVFVSADKVSARTGMEYAAGDCVGSSCDTKAVAAPAKADDGCCPSVEPVQVEAASGCCPSVEAAKVESKAGGCPSKGAAKHHDSI